MWMREGGRGRGGVPFLAIRDGEWESMEGALR